MEPNSHLMKNVKLLPEPQRLRDVELCPDPIATPGSTLMIRDFHVATNISISFASTSAAPVLPYSAFILAPDADATA